MSSRSSNQINKLKMQTFDDLSQQIISPRTDNKITTILNQKHKVSRGKSRAQEISTSRVQKKKKVDFNHTLKLDFGDSTDLTSQQVAIKKNDTYLANVHSIIANEEKAVQDFKRIKEHIASHTSNNIMIVNTTKAILLIMINSILLLVALNNSIEK